VSFFSNLHVIASVQKINYNLIIMGRGRNNEVTFEVENRSSDARERLAMIRGKRLRKQVKVVSELHTGSTQQNGNQFYMYTVGLAALTESKVELICLAIGRHLVKNMEDIFYYIADVVKGGAEVGEEGITFQDEDNDQLLHQLMKCDQSKSKIIREKFATKCKEKDITFLQVVQSFRVADDGSFITVDNTDQILSSALAGHKKHIQHEFMEAATPTAPHHCTDTCDTCDHCGGKDSLKFCAGCYSAMYCSSTCQSSARKAHKKSCSEKMLAGILQVWNDDGAVSDGTKKKIPAQRMIFASFHKEEFSNKKGMFIRHLNKDFQDNSATNLVACHPYAAFTKTDWEVDWWCNLRKVQISYVKKNMKLFASAYEPQIGRAHVSHDDAFRRLKQLQEES
jgi:hypothetical protein